MFIIIIVINTKGAWRAQAETYVCFSIPYLYHTSSTMQRPTWLWL